MEREHPRDPEALLTYDEVGKLLAVTGRTVFTLAKRGELPAVKIGSRVRFDPADVRAFIDRRRTGGDR